MDLQEVMARLRAGDYYRSKEAMGADLLTMVRNAQSYFNEGVDVHHIAVQLEKTVKELFLSDVAADKVALSGSSSSAI